MTSFLWTHRDACGTSPQMRGSMFDCLRPGQTQDSCLGVKGSPVQIRPSRPEGPGQKGFRVLTRAPFRSSGANGSLDTRSMPGQCPAEALHRGDPEPLSELLARRDPISLLPGMANHRTGRDDVVAFFQTIAPKFGNCSPLTFELIAADISGDLAYTVGYEHSAVSIDGGPVVRNDLRVTHIYRREDGVWLPVHLSFRSRVRQLLPGHQRAGSGQQQSPTGSADQQLPLCPTPESSLPHVERTAFGCSLPPPVGSMPRCQLVATHPAAVGHWLDRCNRH